MATFNYTVDTHPMAEEMESVSRNLNKTQGAVVAMKLAVVSAEEKAADLVCNNVNKGFYSLIRSQISQKLAKYQSEVDSLVMQLHQQKNALINIKNRMERDYNMISNRYLKLFNSLNANLKSRVFELDKNTTDFACKEVDKLSNRPVYLTATIPITQLESISKSQKIIASNVKQNAYKVINSMKYFIHEMNIQKILTDEIAIKGYSPISDTTTYIPLIIYEYNSDNTGNLNTSVIVTNAGISANAKSLIINKAYKEIPEIKWKSNSEHTKEIYNEFNNYLSTSEKSARIKEMALKLFQTNNYQTI